MVKTKGKRCMEEKMKVEGVGGTVLVMHKCVHMYTTSVYTNVYTTQFHFQMTNTLMT